LPALPESYEVHQGCGIVRIPFHARAFEPDELLTLLETVRVAPVRLGMAGPDRAMLYALAVSSGLRSAELRSLTPATFDLDADPATVTVAAAYSKHRRDDVQPLPERLVTELRGYLDGRGRTAAVFSMPHPSGVSRMLKADLRLARARWIKAVRGRGERQERLESGFLAYRDDAGRVLDFHAFRHTFVSNLARGGRASENRPTARPAFDDHPHDGSVHPHRPERHRGGPGRLAGPFPGDAGARSGVRDRDVRSGSRACVRFVPKRYPKGG
jgi:integrase